MSDSLGITEYVDTSVFVAILRSRGYLIHAPGAEADRARSDAEIARIVVYARREGERKPADADDVLARLEALLDARIAAEDAAKEAT